MRSKKRRANVRAPAMAAGDTDGTPPLRRMLGNQLMLMIIVVFFKQSWTAKTRAQFSPDHFIGYKLLMSGRLHLGVLDSANTSIDFSRLLHRPQIVAVWKISFGRAGQLKHTHRFLEITSDGPKSLQSGRSHFGPVGHLS